MNTREVARSRSIADMKTYELEKTRLDLSTEIAIRLGHLALSTEQIEVFREGLLNQAEVSLRLSETSYRQGEISLLEYLDAQRTYYSILNDYQNSLYSWNLDRAALAKAVGEEIR
jgi:cobalt-zinc-cadmium efflux system outer membrane protein